ncbi:MAG TPA: hypothetical protein VJH97_05625 [Candidatus Nanoarchaeia archaeon]|nr:hypothetical protein [Candidatus Nanoarchaeia archaeon]
MEKEPVKNNEKPTLTDDQKKELLKLSEISLWLDDYDDIFSDFDPRPYPQRALSDDFLREAKKASRDKKSGRIELKLLIPSAVRDLQHESIVKKRLRDHFKKHMESSKKAHWNLIRQGLSFVALGILLMIMATFMLVSDEETNFMRGFFIVLLEPAGWFLFWEGMHLIVFESKEHLPEQDFYKQMANCEITFLTY